MSSRRAVVAALTLAAAIGCGNITGTGGQPSPSPIPGRSSSSPSVTPTPTPTQTPTQTPSSTATPTTPPPSTPTSTAPTGPVRKGERGARVLALEDRLVALGYWLGKPDGVFGDATVHAVVAVQKVAGLSRDGVVGPATAAVLARGVRPAARTTSGDAIEIDLSRQVLLVVTQGRLTAVLDTSTGGGYTYWQHGYAYVASTPRGRYAITWRYDGWRHSDLGWLWRPAYFVGGYAIHGYAEVPAFPASHGCVRVTMAGMDWLWATGATRPGMPVWIY